MFDWLTNPADANPALDNLAERDVAAAGAVERLSGPLGPADKADHYARVGQAVQRLQAVAQQQPLTDGGGQGGNSNASLTSGFNEDWLAQALAAGSANGAKIGGMGK